MNCSLGWPVYRLIVGSGAWTRRLSVTPDPSKFISDIHMVPVGYTAHTHATCPTLPAPLAYGWKTTMDPTRGVVPTLQPLAVAFVAQYRAFPLVPLTPSVLM